jgi:hypothetical protein
VRQYGQERFSQNRTFRKTSLPYLTMMHSLGRRIDRVMTLDHSRILSTCARAMTTAQVIRLVDTGAEYAEVDGKNNPSVILARRPFLVPRANSLTPACRAQSSTPLRQVILSAHGPAIARVRAVSPGYSVTRSTHEKDLGIESTCRRLCASSNNRHVQPCEQRD